MGATRRTACVPNLGSLTTTGLDAQFRSSQIGNTTVILNANHCVAHAPGVRGSTTAQGCVEATLDLAAAHDGIDFRESARTERGVSENEPSGLFVEPSAVLVALATNILSRVPTIPIILMTAVPFELTRSLGHNLPCLSKPILLDELRTNVQTALARGENLSGA